MIWVVGIAFVHGFILAVIDGQRRQEATDDE